jgi:hypothetical protein
VKKYQLLYNPCFNIGNAKFQEIGYEKDKMETIERLKNWIILNNRGDISFIENWKYSSKAVI